MEQKKERKKTKGKVRRITLTQQYDISLFDSFILLFDMNGEVRMLTRARLNVCRLILWICDAQKKQRQAPAKMKTKALWMISLSDI